MSHKEEYDITSFRWQIEPQWREIGELIQRHIPRPVQSLEDKIITPPDNWWSASYRVRGLRRDTKTARRFLGVLLLSGVLLAAGIVLGRVTSSTIPTYYVRLSLLEPNANSVAVSGDFNHWEVTELSKDPITGVWHVWIAVPEGRHRYVFIIDNNKRIADPMAIERASNGNGGEVSILYVPTRSLK